MDQNQPEVKTMKYEWRKNDKAVYLPKAMPTVVDIGEYAYFTLSGQGNPNDELFTQAIGVLYSLSYAVKMLPKRGALPKGYYEYAVFPLEGVWDLIDKAKAGEKLDKNNLAYTIMIRQPNFLTNALVDEVMEWTVKKKPHALLQNVHFAHMADGLCLQMLHNGSYDDEPSTFAVMHKYCDDNGYIRTQQSHKEIYLTDPRKTSPDKLKTTLRFSIEKK